MPGLVRAFLGYTCIEHEDAPRSSAISSEPDEMQDRLIQHDIGCMKTSSPSSMQCKEVAS